MPARPPDVTYHPTSFAVGAHTVVVAKLPSSSRWSVTIDGARAEATFESEVEAWEEGVRAADRQDRGAGAP
jgi:hypothetical protein